MNIELINTGSELMLGRVLNTHQQWLCRQLADLGYVVTRQVAVADTADDIERAVREALGRADFIITTGGLGPTSDDITRDRIAALLGRKLHEDPAIVAHVESFFAQRNRPMPASTRVQAMVPDGALVLANAHGTAPGLALHVSPNPFRPEGKPSWLVMLPGPPRELRPMFTNQVTPLLKERLPLDADFVCRTLRTVGIGESYLEERIAGPLKPLTDAGLELGYCAHTGAVDVRFVARGCGADADVAEAARIVHELAGEHIFGEGDDELEQVLVRRLTERKQTLALAESCTGGFIANRITSVPGASAVFLAGLVTYSNAAKEHFLGVRAATLAAHGAVSEPVAREMAEGARAKTGADFALAVTGIAGPGGGTPEKPVGTVFIALASAAGTKVINPVNRYDRETFKYLTSLQALELLRRAMKRAGEKVGE
ncbi:MAG: competence/damage-inducible protein CinA [Limisphaerales bacterium]|nr:MAG: competence/damage-inducible protein CinA [Limisphaerales bacterium]KAG0508973.1 MAG: competence/damage-inducible protein CinA [Limisphaerales bacterium]TXT51306.1 MAG: competence/damage-inducible protein CinA [Limisphaerales bacterium]